MASCVGSVPRMIVTRSAFKSCTRSTPRTACPSLCSTSWRATADRSPFESATPPSSNSNSTFTASSSRPPTRHGNRGNVCPSRDGRFCSASWITSSSTGKWKTPESGNRVAGRAAVRRTRDTIKREVLELGYDPEIGAFTQALGHKDLDATALAVAMYEMLPPTDPRVVSTVKVLQEKLSNKGFLYRYVPDQSEFHQPEGVFIICTLWLVNVLAQMGRREEAEALFSRVTESANDLGLFAEEFDPETNELLGNFPQALTHLSVINAALNLEGRPSGKGRRSGSRDGR